MENFKSFSRTKKGLSIVGMAIGGVVIAAVLALLFGFFVMLLWNWLMPEIFGLTKITFWQAWGLVVLSHILFKSFPHHGHDDHDRHWKEKFRSKFMAHKDEDTYKDESGAVG